MGLWSGGGTAMKRILAGLFLALVSSALVADELIIFSMPGCLPCARLKQLLAENPELLQGFSVSTVDIVDQPAVAELFGVSSVPTMVRLDDKTRERARRVGLLTKKELKEWLDNAGK